MLLEELIFERSRASLYHVTWLSFGISILKENLLKGGPKNDPTEQGMISFTRNPRYNILSGMSGQKIRLEFDQDTLRTKYAVRPRVWHGFGMQKKDRNSADFRILHDESEEYVMGPITNLDRYLIEIAVPPDGDRNPFDLYKNYLMEKISFFFKTIAKEASGISSAEILAYDSDFRKKAPVGKGSAKANDEYDLWLASYYSDVRYLIEHPKMNPDHARKLQDILDQGTVVFDEQRKMFINAS